MKSGRKIDDPKTMPGYRGPSADDLPPDPLERPATEHSMDENVVREMGYEFVDLIVEYWKGLEGRRVYGPMSPVGLDEMFEEPVPENGAPLKDVLQECRAQVFPNTMAIGSRRYFGMMNPSPMPVAVFAEALASAMNQNVASWRHAPAERPSKNGSSAGCAIYSGCPTPVLGPWPRVARCPTSRL